MKLFSPALLATAAALLVSPAFAVDYPGPLPGNAAAQTVGSALVLSNTTLSARFEPLGNSLKLASVTRPGGAVFSGADDLFRIYFTNGTVLSSSAMSLAAPAVLTPLATVSGSPRLADQFPGQSIMADFRNAAGTLQVQWRAELRNGSGYLRQSLAFSALSGNFQIKEIGGLLGNLTGGTISGYTDGSVATGDGFFAGLETPLAKLAYETAGVSVGSWTPALVAPKQMNFPVAIPAAGEWKVTFQYTSGNHRLDVTKVQLLNDTQLVSEDVHAGYAGVPSSNNIYNLQVPAAGNYTLRVFNTYPNSETNSNGNITAAPTAGAGSPPLVARWPRNLTLSPGTTWETHSVIGAYEPGQLRRSFLHYLERERDHPYRQFVHYNSWYDLNINRNNSSDPLQRMTESQVLGVIDAWNQQLYTQRGVKLDGFVWDDGWDNFNSLWDFHVGFPNGFATADQRARNQQAGTGAWLSPWGGYGSSKNQRVAYWNSTHDPDISGFHMSDPEYYAAFRGRCQQMLADYDMRYFKFDGIGAGTFATGPAPGNEADIDALLRLHRDLRATRPDVFINSTVGTWASPFWLMTSDSIWRQGDDASFSGSDGNQRERWITYRDNMVYDRFTANAPLFPISALMFHGLLIGNYPNTAPAQMPLDVQSVKNEIRASMGIGTGLQELYVTHGIMTPALWDELAKGIRWLRANRDVLADVRWIGGDPLNGSNSYSAYGWAAWHPRKGTLTLRNPSASAKTLSFTLANALELPAGAATSYTIRAGYDDQRSLAGITGASVATTATLDFTLQPFEVLVFDLWPAGASIPDAALSASAATPETFGAWCAARGQTISQAPGSLQAAFRADADGNGIQDGIEFAAGNGAMLVARPAANGEIIVDVPLQVPATADSVEMKIEAGVDLQNWDRTPVAQPGAPAGSSRWSLPGEPQAFFRLAAQLR